jgi:hypothetical protein
MTTFSALSVGERFAFVSPNRFTNHNTHGLKVAPRRYLVEESGFIFTAALSAEVRRTAPVQVAPTTPHNF